MLKEILTATNNSNVDTANETVKFEIGKTYYAADFAGEWSEDAPVIVKTLNVIKRTAKTLTAIDENGNQVLKRISLAYAGMKETVVVSSVNDITVQTVHIYSDKEYTPAIAAAPTAHFNAWVEAITGTKAETYTPQSTWEDPHNYTTAGNLTGTSRSYNFDADNYANVILAATVEEYAVTTAAFDGTILCEMHTAKVASGTYNITINGEYVSFKNHSIVRIDATRERQMYLEKDCKGRNRFYVFNPGHGQNKDGADDSSTRISARAVAERYMAKEAAKEQGKNFAAFFAPYRTSGVHEFTVMVCLTYVDGRKHIFSGEFNQYRQAQQFISDVKAFAGDTPCQFFTKTRDHSHDVKPVWEDPHNYETVGCLTHARNLYPAVDTAPAAEPAIAETATVEEKAEVLVPIVDYRTLLTWAEKVSNGQHDAAIQIVTHIKKWFNAETDKKTVIEVIKAGDLNGFRNFLCQFNFAVKYDGGYIHKLYRYDNGECVLAEIPTSEYAKYSVEELEAELPSGNITVNSGAEAWAVVGKHFPKGNLEFYRAYKGFNNADNFCYTLDEIIYVHVTCTPDNSRVELIEVINTYEESESERNILTVNIAPPVKAEETAIENEPIIIETANEELDGYNPDVFDLLPKLEDLNDVDGEFGGDAAEYTDRDDRYNRGEKIAEALTAKLRPFDPTVEVTYTINEDGEDTYYLSYDGISRMPFTATGVEPSFHAMKQDEAKIKADPWFKAQLNGENKAVDVKKVSAVVYYTCADDKSNWAKDKYFETTPAAAEWILSFVKTRVFDCTVRDAEIIDRRNGYVRYALTDADITAVNTVNTEPELPTPKPDSPCAIARGLDDVFQKTFHRVDAPYLDVTTQDGAKIATTFGAAFISVDWRATDGYVFGNHFNDVLARYETPEQVIDVMTALRDAVKAGKTEFAFPTAEALTPEEPAPDDAKSTFDRVMKARRHGIGHVTTKQGRRMWYIYGRLVSKKEITKWLADEGFTVEEYIAAENELKLYNICRAATRELWKE